MVRSMDGVCCLVNTGNGTAQSQATVDGWQFREDSVGCPSRELLPPPRTQRP